MATLQLKTRFAPSPTGYLHLGHIVHLLYVFGLAKRKKAQILFRIEDHDQSRCRRVYQDAIISDLQWLGFAACPSLLNPLSPSIQSNRFDAYDRLARELFARGLVYGCSCSRKDIQRRTETSAAIGQELRYDGHCRDRGLPFDGNHGLRFVVPDVEVVFMDDFLGQVTGRPAAECGDFLLRERSGLWTYQFAVVVDDQQEGINWIIRGQDILPSTGRQILLAEAFGASNRPRYAHHPLILDEVGRKLAKRDGDIAVGQRRLRGEKPEAILGEAAHAGGLLSAPVSLGIDEITDLFAAI